jgi:thioredoxin-related protein
MFYRTFCAAFLLLSLASGALAQGWESDYSGAVEKAKAENKKVLLDFTGSDWCGPCIEFNKRVFSRPEFRTYADKNLVVVEIDYPQRKKQSLELKKQNEKLGREYGLDEKGFPTIVLLDSNGKVMREFTGYNGEEVADVIAWIEGRKKM